VVTVCGTLTTGGAAGGTMTTGCGCLLPHAASNAKAMNENETERNLPI
jgi:hypothetical protein